MPPFKSKSKSKSNPESGSASASGSGLELYIVLRTSGYDEDGYHLPSVDEVTIMNVLGNEEQAYAEAIRKLMGWVHNIGTCHQKEIRDVLKEKCTSLKQLFQKIVNKLTGSTDDFHDILMNSKVIHYDVVKKQVMPFMKVNERQVLDEALKEHGSGISSKRKWAEDEGDPSNGESNSDAHAHAHADFDANAHAGRKKPKKGKKKKKNKKRDEGITYAL